MSEVKCPECDRRLSVSPHENGCGRPDQRASLLRSIQRWYAEGQYDDVNGDGVGALLAIIRELQAENARMR